MRISWRLTTNSSIKPILYSHILITKWNVTEKLWNIFRKKTDVFANKPCKCFQLVNCGAISSVLRAQFHMTNNEINELILSSQYSLAKQYWIIKNVVLFPLWFLCREKLVPTRETNVKEINDTNTNDVTQKNI